MCKDTDRLLKSSNKLASLMTEAFKENKSLKEKNEIHDVFTYNSEDIVYITDIETSEVLYANEEAKRLFGDVVGKNCYEALQGLHEECNFCTNDIIKKQPGKVHKWVFYNKTLGKMFYIRDVAKEVNGRLLRFERAINLNGEVHTIIELYNKYNLNKNG